MDPAAKASWWLVAAVVTAVADERSIDGPVRGLSASRITEVESGA
jgi:hypothetical protein